MGFANGRHTGVEWKWQIHYFWVDSLLVFHYRSAPTCKKECSLFGWNIYKLFRWSFSLPTPHFPQQTKSPDPKSGFVHWLATTWVMVQIVVLKPTDWTSSFEFLICFSVFVPIPSRNPQKDREEGSWSSCYMMPRHHFHCVPGSDITFLAILSEIPRSLWFFIIEIWRIPSVLYDAMMSLLGTHLTVMSWCHMMPYFAVFCTLNRSGNPECSVWQHGTPKCLD